MHIENFTKFFQIFLSLMALILAYFGYKKFIARQAVTKQIDHLSTLIKEIQSTKIQLKHNSIHNNKEKNAYHIEYLTLFEIGNIHRIFKDKAEEVRATIVVKYRDDNVFPYLTYVYHPLTPTAIADCLAMFIDKDLPTFFVLGKPNLIDSKVNTKEKLELIEVMSVNFNSEYLDFNILNKDSETQKEFHANVSNAKALTNYFVFSKCAYDLEQEIAKWFQKIGISDVNIRRYDNF